MFKSFKKLNEVFDYMGGRNYSEIDYCECLSKDISVNNGGKTSYYDVPVNSVTLNDLIEAKNMPFWRGEAFKALYALEERALKGDASEERELNKVIYYCNRRLSQLRNKNET